MKKFSLLIITDLISFLIGAGVSNANMSCGFKPIPPIGCTVGMCVCDHAGCRWQLICK